MVNERSIVDILSGRRFYAGSSLPLRQFGAGPVLPVLGMGGEVVFTHGSERQAWRVFREAYRQGVRYIDTAHDYKNSQKRLGRFFKQLPEGGSELFVATKSGKRERDGFLRELDSNIKLLGRTPDVMHVHAVHGGEQQVVTAKNGPLEAALEAKDQGLCRYVGVTSHACPQTMCEIVRMAGDEIDVMMIAISAGDTRFLPELIPLARSRNIALVAMKVMGRGRLIRPSGPGVRSAADAMHFVLSCPVDLVIVGFSYPMEVVEAAAAVRSFQPLTQQQMDRLEAGTALYGDELWWYQDALQEWDDDVSNPMRRPGQYHSYKGLK
jgi:aryl-alcohol dehydrogenase-like predicted oxidoreductase